MCQSRNTARSGAIVESLESRQLLTTLVVNLNTDPTGAHSGESLRDAINTANSDGSGDTITFSNSLAGQTITLTQGELQITGSMTITGLGASQLAINGNNSSRIFDVASSNPQTVVISGLTLQNGDGIGLNGNGNGGAIFNSETLTLSADMISQNTALFFNGNGGGIYNSQGALTLTNDSIAGNQASQSGGGIFSTAGTVNSIGDTYSGNSATNEHGGGIYNDGTFTSTNDTISGNSAFGAGGIFNNVAATLTTTNDTITGNVLAGRVPGGPTDPAGGIYNSSIINMLNTIVVGNTVSSGGDFYGALPSSSSANNLTNINNNQTLANILQTVPGSNPLQPFLADNGGATLTVALAPGSPADNVGGALAHVSLTGDGGATLTVDNTTFLAAGDYLRIGSEIVLVTSVNNATTVNVQRAQAGTIQQANLGGQAVTLAFDQRGFNRNTNDIGAVLQSSVSNASEVVTVGGDTHVAGFTTLREAIQHANMGDDDTISFASNLAGQTITLTQGELPITASMTITGLGVITVDGNNSSRIFDISSSASQNVVITGLTLQHGNGTGTNMSGDGGAIYNAANLTLANDIISANSTSYGGGIYNDGTVTSMNDTIANNVASFNGGGIFESKGSFTLFNDTISGNSAGNGGGILVGFSGTMTSNNDSITGNSVIGYGGGIYTDGVLTSTNDTISGNLANGGGGAILNYINGTLTTTNDTITGNTAVNDFGGGIYNGSTMNWINTILVGNSESNGDDFYGTLPSIGSNNLTSIPAGQTLSSILQTIPGSNPLQPLLGNHGGPTQTVSLAVGSVAAGSGGALTTLGGNGLSSTATTATVVSATFIAIGDSIKIDNEIMTVTGISGATLTLLRGQFGTTATAHAANANVYLGLDQRGVIRTGNDIGSSAMVTPTINLTVSGGTYTSSAFAVSSASVVGVDGQQIGTLGDVSISYYSGMLTSSQIASAVPLNAPPKDVGTYTVVGNYTSNLAGYSNATSAPVYFTITPASLTITAATNTKLYDGTTSASATPTVSGLLGTDTVTGLKEAYASKDVLGAGGSTLVVTGDTVNDGNGGLDYTVTLKTATGTITPAALTISATTNTKVYDGTTSASGMPTVSGLLGTDSVTGLKEAYTMAHVLGLNASTLTVTGETVNDGNGGLDYTVTLKTATGTITPAALTISAASNTKVYDATTSASAKPTVSGLLSTDTVTGLTEAYSMAHVLGLNGSTLTVTGDTVNDGNGGKDYTVTLKTATGTITPAALTISAVSNTKVYDSTTSASEMPTVSGLLSTDTATGLKEAYTSKDVLGAGGSTLIVTGDTINDGNGGKDYTVTLKTATGTITPAALTISAASNTKVYDSTTSASATPTVSGLLGTDTVTGLKEAYTSKDVLGVNGSALTVTGDTVNDGNGGHDYTVTLRTGAGTITPAALTISATTNTKVYDGTTSASAKPTVSGLLGTDSVSGLTESYASKAVLGTGNSTLVVNAGYVVADGNGGRDYTVATTTAAGTITPAAAATKLVFSQATPTTGTAGVKLNSSVVVSVEDSLGNVVTTNTSTVTISISSGPTGASFATGSTVAVNAVAGVATFSNLIFDTAGTYTLKVNDGALVSASFNVTIVPAAATKLAFISVPGTGKLGSGLASPVKVAIEDAFGNIVTGNVSSVTIVAASGPTHGGLAVGDILTVKAVNGIATFSNLKFTKAGGYKLEATSGALSVAISSSILIS